MPTTAAQLIRQAKEFRDQEKAARASLDKLRDQLRHAAMSGLLNETEKREALALARKPRSARSGSSAGRS